LPIILGTIINSLKTVCRLYKYTKKKKYDLFLTDDLLVCIGKLKRVPTLLFQDDDLRAVPESSLLLFLADRVVAPRCSNMGIFKYKKIEYDGNHELAYLHPRYFTPDYKIVENFNPSNEKFFILRLVSLTASHDRGKRGMSDKFADQLIKILEKYGNIYITSERSLPNRFEKYRINLDPRDIAHALYYADMFVGDSQTMTSEAAILGTPAIRFNDFVGKISYLEEEEKRFDLTYGFKTSEFDNLLKKVAELLSCRDLKEIWQKKRKRLLDEYIDVTAFFIRLIESFNVR
jgi:predicted glycosyltransferase